MCLYQMSQGTSASLFLNEQAEAFVSGSTISAHASPVNVDETLIKIIA